MKITRELPLEKWKEALQRVDIPPPTPQFGANDFDQNSQINQKDIIFNFKEEKKVESLNDESDLDGINADKDMSINNTNSNTSQYTSENIPVFHKSYTFNRNRISSLPQNVFKGNPIYKLQQSPPKRHKSAKKQIKHNHSGDFTAKMLREFNNMKKKLENVSEEMISLRRKSNYNSSNKSAPMMNILDHYKWKNYMKETKFT